MKSSTKLLVTSFVLFAAAFVFGGKVFGQAILDVNNLLLNTTQARNYTYSPPSFAGSGYDNDGYLTVGVGEFQRYNLVMTIDSPTPSLTLTIIDATICNSVSPGDYTSIDNPSDAADGTTFIVGGVIEPGGGTTLADYWSVVGVGYDCVNRNRTVTINNMTPLSDGSYGGYLYAVMAPRAPGTSHQNSFKLQASNPGAHIGYVSEVVRRLRNWGPNAPFLNFVGLTAGQQVGISISNVGQPQFSYSHFNVGMAIPCNSARNSFSTTLGFFDVDDPSGAAAEPGGVVGSYWQGTAQFPTARIVVYEQLIGSAAWTPITNQPLVGVQGGAGSGRGAGRGSEFQVNVGPFRKGYRYQFEVQNISRANAIQFSILDPDADLSTTAYEQPCGQDPIGWADDCEVIGGQTVIYGWAYDNDLASGPQVQLSLSGIGNQTVTANLGTYASWQSAASINSALNTWGYGASARDNRYGWRAVFNGVLTSGNYNLSGTVVDAGAAPNPNQPLNINGGVFGAGGSLPNRCKYTPPPPTVDLRINGSNGPLSIFEGDNVNVSWSSTDSTGCTASRSPQGSSTWVGARGTSSAGENHNADSATLGTFTYSISCTGLGAPPNGTDSVVLTIRQIPNKPFYQVRNGDVSAGKGFGSSCTTVGSAPLAAYNNGAPNYLGSGSYLAAFDLGTVTGFATGIGNASLPKPKSLTFANTGAGAAGSTYGGGLGGNGCAINYYGLPKTGASAWGGSFTNGEYTASGNTTLAAGGAVTIAPGNKVTLFVNGNVHIRNNILLSTASTYNAMPTFYLIVRGNIYIDYRVNQLEGIFVAQNSTAANGKIYTCATGFAAPNATQVGSTPLSPAAYPPICGQSQLVVNGALLAKQVKLLRSRSKVENCTNAATCLGEAAEIINYTPQTWIPPRTTTPAGTKKYDAITSLPPVL